MAAAPLYVRIFLTLLLWRMSGGGSCSPQCVCYLDDDGDVTAKCHIRNVEKTELVLPESTKKLDISNNNLTELHSWIFSRTPNITHLSMANNRISTIKENTFKDLPLLENIDLTNNSLQRWDVDVKNELPKLRILGVTGNPFIPDQRFLTLPMLVIIEGVTWSESCRDCLLVRTSAVEIFTRMNISFCLVETKDYFTFSDEVKYGKSQWFSKNGFLPQCLCESDQCYSTEVGEPYNLELNLIIRKLFYIEYVIGAIAITLNVIVVLIIILSRPLHKPSFIMICNVALCDLLIGFYSVLTGRFTVYEFIVNEDRYKGMDIFVNPYCTVMGFIFTMTQVVAVPTTLLMTIERFLSIVYCMNPDIRLRKRLTLKLLAVFWLCGLGYALLPVFRVGGLRQHGEYTCTLPFVDGKNNTDVNGSTLVVSILLALVYLTGSCLYFPIYRYVKNTNASAGIKRKAALAKNITIMITTNFVFFLLPLISILIFAYSYESFAKLLKVDTLKGWQTYYIFLSWLPVVLLGVNSCLNPFLCAFRHPKFKSQFKLLLNKVRRKEASKAGLATAAMSSNDSSNGPFTINITTRNVVDLGISNVTLRSSCESLSQL